MLLELEVDFFLVPYTVYYSVCIYIYIQYIYIYIHYTTLHYTTLHYITLHCIALHYITYIYTIYIYIFLLSFIFFLGNSSIFSWIIRGSPCRRRCSSQHNASGRVPWPWEGRHGSNLWKIIGKPSENHRKTIGKWWFFMRVYGNLMEFNGIYPAW